MTGRLERNRLMFDLRVLAIEFFSEAFGLLLFKKLCSLSGPPIDF